MKTLYKKDLNGNIRCWKIEVEGNSYRSHSWILGRENTSYQVTEPTYTESRNVGKVNATTAEEQAIKVAEALYRVRYEQGFYDTVEDAGKGKNYFQPMLASKYTKFMWEKAYVQAKLDGIHCIITREGMFSRNGKPILSAPHIREYLEPLFQKYPDTILDGELYSHVLNEDFNKIISLVRKSKPTEEDLKESAKFIQFWWFDLPSSVEKNYRRCLEIAELYYGEFNMGEQESPIVAVPTYEVKSDADVQHYLEVFLELGFEGAIVRLDETYECKRSKNLLKVKKFEDAEFPIIRIEEGRGNLAGKAGRIIVDVNGKEVSSGLKFGHDEAKKIWENRDNLIGKTATIRYFNVTEDGSLRFPKCVDIGREDWE